MSNTEHKILFALPPVAATAPIRTNYYHIRYCDIGPDMGPYPLFDSIPTVPNRGVSPDRRKIDADYGIDLQTRIYRPADNGSIIPSFWLGPYTSCTENSLRNR